MITVDTMIDMNVTDAAGTVLDITIIEAGTQGLETSWSPVEAGFTVEDGVMKMPFPVDVREVSGFLQGTTTRAFHYDNANAFRLARYFVPWPIYTTVTVGGWISIGVPNLGVGLGREYIPLQINTVNGFVSVVLNNGDTPTTSSGYGLGISSFVQAGDPPTAVLLYSTEFTEILPSTFYWVTLSADYGSGVSQLFVYDIDGNPIGETIFHSFDFSAPAYVNSVIFGNNGIGNDGGITKFECWLVDYTTGQFPLRPFADLSQAKPTDHPFPYRPGVPVRRRA